MNKLLLLVGCIFSISISTSAQPMKLEKSFLVGEELEYLMYYGWIDGGKVNLKLTETTISDKTVSYAYIKAQTAGVAHKVYNLLNIFECWFNPNDFLPVKAKVYKEEGPKYKYKEDVTYNHKDNYVQSSKKGKVMIEENSLDIVSAFYFIRQINFNAFNKGELLTIPTFLLGDPYTLRVKYLGKETIEVDLGEFECHKLMPVTSGSSFDADDSMTLYITNDGNGIPIHVKLDLWVGSLKMDLITYKGLKHPLTLATE